MMNLLLRKFDEVPYRGGEEIVHEWKKELDTLLGKIQGGILVSKSKLNKINK